MRDKSKVFDDLLFCHPFPILHFKLKLFLNSYRDCEWWIALYDHAGS